MSVTPQPDYDMALQHLKFLFGRALSGSIEIAWTDTATPKHPLSRARQFNVSDLELAAECACIENRRKNQSVYVGAALRSPDWVDRTKRASDADFLEAWAIHADLDDEGAVDKARAKYLATGLPPSFRVVTGTHPHTRAQLWWLLDEPIKDASFYSAFLRGFAQDFEGDRTVINPSRVMRLGGTIAWPLKPGRVIEQTRLDLLEEGGE